MSITNLNLANEDSLPKWSFTDGVSLESGLSLIVERRAFDSPVSLSFEFTGPLLLVGFQVSGRTRSTFYQGGPLKPIEFSPGDNGIAYYHDATGKLEYSGETEGNCAISILLQPQLLARYLESETDGPPAVLSDVLDAKPGIRFFRRFDHTPVKQMLLDRLLNYSRFHSCKLMFLEATCLELVALQLAECVNEGKSRRSVKLTRSDTERIRAARDMLISDLENPPTTLELARKVGINDFKLKQGFREVFGTTLFGYFRDYRLDKARAYLDGGETNVSTAASRVGYVNLSHFSKAFHDKFGVKPKEYLKAHSIYRR